MSFLADPPLLVAAGAAIERAPLDERAATWAGRAVVALFVGVSGALYADVDATRPMWRLLRARSGKDWMVNSGVLSLDVQRPSRRRDAGALVLFALYPAWLRLGRTLARR